VSFLYPDHATGGYDEVQTWPGGNVCYLLDGHFHRVDGPALIGADGSTTWFRHGREHREGGPAVEDPRSGFVEYWIDGIQFTRDAYARSPWQSKD
jgi:hypothetical protein